MSENTSVGHYHYQGRFAGAFRRGRLARQQGLPRSACPYQDKRTDYKNGVTFSRAYMSAWQAGWSAEEGKMSKQREMA